MRIGIDTKGYIRLKNHGIGNYSLGLWKALFENQENEYILLTWGCNSIKDELFPDFANVSEYIAGEIDTEWDLEYVRYHLMKMLNENDVDVFYDSCPMFGVSYDRAWFGKTMLVATVYDFIPYLLRDSYFDNNNKYLLYLKKMYALFQYDYLFAISENTKLDAIKILGINKDRIENISMDVNYKSIENGLIQEKKSGDLILPQRFITSSVWAGVNKNIPRLFEAYGKAYMVDENVPDLVLTGKGFDNYRTIIEENIKKYKTENKIHFCGYVSDEEMDYIYSKSEWIIFPSLYEGFGMPVVEAWRHHVPVITSNNSSLYEIAHDAAVIVDPTDCDSICDGILKATSMSECERQKYVKLGEERANDFSWNKTAHSFCECISKWESGRTFDEIDFLDKMEKMSSGIREKSEYVIKNDYIRRCAEEYEGKKQIIVFGAGINGKKCIKIIKSLNEDLLKAVCDNYSREKSIAGVPILKLDDCIKRFPEAYYVITPKNGSEEIKKQLNEANIDEKNIGYFAASKI